MPTVSVIIPNYNHAPYLKERIDSVLNQTYQDFEVIILDDKSTDNSREVIEQYRNHPKISHIIYNEINSGSTFKQWEKGIELATGEWIWIAESDDWCEYNLLESLITGIIKNSEKIISFAYCQSYFVLPNHQFSIRGFNGLLEDVFSKESFLEDHLIPKNEVYNASMAIFRKSFFPEISEEYKNYKYCGDWVFWAELSRKGDIFRTIKPLNYFRKQGGQDVSTNIVKYGNNFIEELKALNHFKNHLNCKNSQISKATQKLFFEFRWKKKIFSVQKRKEILKAFIFTFGSWTVIRYEFAMIKNFMAYKIFLKIFKKLKEY